MASNDISLWYPKDILSYEHGKRHVKIIVKENKNFLEAATKNGAAAFETTVANAKKVFEDSVEGKSLSAPDKVKLLETGETVFGIALPLPNELTDIQEHGWSTSTSMIKDMADKITGNKIVDTVTRGLKEIASNTAYRKPLVDPGYFQDYKGSEPRNMSLTFTLMPNNEFEALMIKNIIYKIKQYTLPQTQVNALLLRSPYYFELTFGNKQLDDMICFKNVVCRNVTVSYGTDGAMQFFADGTPKVINLTLAFAERSLMTSNIYSAMIGGE